MSDKISTGERLRLQAINKLKKERLYWDLITADLGVSKTWVKKMAANKIPNPGVVTVGLVVDWTLKDHQKKTVNG